MPQLTSFQVLLQAEKILAGKQLPPKRTIVWEPLSNPAYCFNQAQQSLCDHCKRVRTLITDGEIETGCNAIPKLVRDYLLYASKKTSSPMLFHVASCFTVLSTVARRQVKIPFAHKPTCLNTWFLILATPRVYHKTTSMDIGNDLMVATKLDNYLLPQDTTPEALVNVLQTIPQGTLVRDEFSGFMSTMKKDYGAGLKDFLMALFDCPDTYSRILRKEQVSLRYLFLSLLSGTTVTNFLSKLEREDWTTGFTARFLFVLPDEPAVYKDAAFATPDLQSDRQDLINALDKIIPRIDTGLFDLSLTPEALSLYNKYGRDIQNEVDAIGDQEARDSLASNYSELQVYSVKLAALMAMVDPGNTLEVDKESNGIIVVGLPLMLAGITLAEIFKDQFRRLRTEQELRVDQYLSDKVRERIYKAAGMTYRDLLHYSHIKASILKPILADLKTKNVIEEREDGRYYPRGR